MFNKLWWRLIESDLIFYAAHVDIKYTCPRGSLVLAHTRAQKRAHMCAHHLSLTLHIYSPLHRRGVTGLKCLFVFIESRHALRRIFPFADLDDIRPWCRTFPLMLGQSCLSLSLSLCGARVCSVNKSKAAFFHILFPFYISLLRSPLVMADNRNK